MKNGSYKKIEIKSLIILLSQPSNMTGIWYCINCTKAIYTSISTKILKVWLSDPEVLPQIPDIICSCGIDSLIPNIQEYVSNADNSHWKDMDEGIELSELLSNSRVTYDECDEHIDETGYVNKIGKHKSLLAARLRKQTRDNTDKRWKTPSPKKRTTASYLAEHMD